MYKILFDKNCFSKKINYKINYKLFNPSSNYLLKIFFSMLERLNKHFFKCMFTQKTYSINYRSSRVFKN